MNPVEYACRVPGWMTERELVWLSRTAAGLKPGAVWCEVGTWMGRSWSCVALSLPQGSAIISVDTFRGELAEPLAYVQENGPVLIDFMRAHEDVRRQKPDLMTQIISMKSWDAARFVPDKSCDVIFIDGNHGEEAARGDIRAWHPKLKPGGLLCGHDISEPGVRTALNKFGHRYAYDDSDSPGAGSIWWLQ